MDPRRAVASASSTVIDLVALAPQPLLWFYTVSAMPCVPAGQRGATHHVGVGPGEQWPDPWSAVPSGGSRCLIKPSHPINSVGGESGPSVIPFH